MYPWTKLNIEIRQPRRPDRIRGCQTKIDHQSKINMQTFDITKKPNITRELAYHFQATKE